LFYIKQYFHISDITKQLNIFSELEPLSDYVIKNDLKNFILLKSK